MLMTSLASELRRVAHPMRSALSWRGRSGRTYLLAAENAADIAMTETALYVLLREARVAWVGSFADIIADAQSRARFRAALGAGARVYSLPAADTLEAMSVAWDIERGAPELGRSAA